MMIIQDDPSRHSRRNWLRSAAALAAASTICGCARPRPKLKVFNWSDYIHEDLISEFEQQASCTVVYDNYSSDSELETRLATGAGSYDVVFPSDRALTALIAKELLQPIDRSQLPNFRHLDPKFLGRPFDAENRFSVPYFLGTLALGVRTDFVTDKVAGLEPLFDSGNHGRITMLDDMENVIAAALCHLKLPLNSVEQTHLNSAQLLLLQQKPLVQAYTSDSYRERLISGEAWAALGWSGDLLQADTELADSRGNARVAVVIPPQGTMLWMDSMVIPSRAQRADLAHAFINFLLDSRVAALNAQKVNYATPNAAARSLLPAATLANTSIYLPDDLVDRCTWLEDRGDLIERIERVWRIVRM
jgi:spermidine/putrescine transport system substrate-binding protein